MSWIDAHVHLLPKERLAGLMRWIHRAFPDHPVPLDTTLEQNLDDLRRAGVRLCFNLMFSLSPGEAPALNRFSAAVAREHPWVVPFGCVHPEEEEPLAVVEEAIEGLGLAGLKFHPMVQRADPWAERMRPVYAWMEEKRKPIFFHSGFDEWYGHWVPTASFVNILSSYPGLPVVIAHMLFPRFDEAFDLLERFPQVTFDLTNVLGALKLGANARGGEPLSEAALLREGLERWSERVMLGTDHPAGMGDVETILRDLRDFGLSAGATENLLHGAAERFIERHLCGYL